MITSGEALLQIPYRCPACDRTLYSSAFSRPGPSSRLPARLLFVVAGLIAATTYLALTVVLREKLAWRTPLNDEVELVHYPPTIGLSLITLPVALVPGLAIGWIATRFRKVRLVRCWNCGWRQKYPLSAVWAPEPAASGANVSRTGQPSIVDDSDPWTECRAWAYAEIRTGRLPEDVTEELIAQGWPRDDVEIMVEKCRREARDRKLQS